MKLKQHGGNSKKKNKIGDMKRTIQLQGMAYVRSLNLSSGKPAK